MPSACSYFLCLRMVETAILEITSPINMRDPSTARQVEANIHHQDVITNDWSETHKLLVSRYTALLHKPFKYQIIVRILE